MKKTIGVPLVLGSAFGALSFLSSAVGFVIPIGIAGSIGPQEIFAVLAAALGGPPGLLVASSLHSLGAHFFLFHPLPELATAALWNVIGDCAARTLALLAVAFSYRYLHQRAQRPLAFFAGWSLIVVGYYALLLPLQGLNWALTLPGYLSLATIVQTSPPEVITVWIVTTLVWVALPVRRRRPLWVEARPAGSSPGDRAHTPGGRL